MKRISSIAVFAAIALMTSCGGDSKAPLSTVNAPNSATTLSHLTGVGDNYDTVVQQLYVAYFGRPADNGGLANFKSMLASSAGPSDIQGMDAAYNSNQAIKALIDSFGASAESNALYGTGDSTGFVTAIYTNVLNRPPDPAGLQFWVNAINAGTLTRARASFSIMAGALANTTPQGLTDAALVRNRVQVASNFTHGINNPAIYVGDAAAATARSMLARVTSETSPASFQDTVSSTLNTLATQATSSGTSPLPIPSSLRISSDLVDAEPMTPLILKVTSGTGVPAALPEKGYSVQIATNDAFTDALEVLAYPKAQDSVTIAVPDSSYLTGGQPNQQTILHLRLKRNTDNAFSNGLTIRIRPTLLDSRFTMPGQATALAGNLSKIISRATGDPLASTYGGAENVASHGAVIFDQVRKLGGDTTLLDIRAQQFINAIRSSDASILGRRIEAIPPKASTTAATELRMAPAFAFVQDYVDAQMSCLRSRWNAVDGTASNEMACADGQEFKNVTDIFIGGLTDLKDRIAAVGILGKVAATRLAGRLGTFVGSGGEFFSKVGETSMLAETSTKYLTYGVRAAIDPKDTAVKFASDEIAGKVYEKYTGSSGESAQAIFTLTGVEQKFTDSVSNLIQNTLNSSPDAIRRNAQDVADSVTDATSAMQNYFDKNAPQDADSTANKQSACTALGIGCGQTNSTQPDTEEDFCGALGGPDTVIGGGAGYPAVTCGHFSEALSDPTFEQEELIPFSKVVERSFPSMQVTGNALQACLGRNPSSLNACALEQSMYEQASSPVTAATQGLLEAAQRYRIKDFNKCPTGYTNRGAEDRNSTQPLICVHSSLLLPDAVCPAGSYLASEKGIKTVAPTCLWYDRDFIQAGNTCRPNYSLVEYKGYETCRWSKLASGQAAVLAVDRKNGRKRVIRE